MGFALFPNFFRVVRCLVAEKVVESKMEENFLFLLVLISRVYYGHVIVYFVVAKITGMFGFLEFYANVLQSVIQN